MYRQIFFDFSLPGWLFFLVACVLIFFAVLVYRKTLPPLNRGKRNLLIILRAAVLIIVLFLLLQPVLNFIFRERQPPTVAVLLDNSSSMNIVERGAARSDSVRWLLNRIKEIPSSDSLVFRYFKFDSKPVEMIDDSLDFGGSQTNLSAALLGAQDSLQGENLKSIILISDGQYNQGILPTSSWSGNLPAIQAFTVGDTLPPRDIKISGLDVNRVGYAGSDIPLVVRFIQNGLPPGRVQLRLRRNGKQVDSRMADLPRSGFEQRVDFEINEKQPGEFRYSVEVGQYPDESIARNNRSSFLLKVLPSKMRVLLVSGQPSFDERLLLHVLKKKPEIKLRSFTQKRNGEFYEAKLAAIQPDSLDAQIWLGFPNAETRPETIRLLAEKSTPVFLFLTSKTVISNAVREQFHLPVSPRPIRGNEIELTPRLTAAGRLHAVTRLDDDLNNLHLLWSHLPPVKSYQTVRRDMPGTIVLLEGAGKGKSARPLLLAGIQSDVKSLYFCATGIGSWQMLLQDDPARDQFLSTFMERALKWLTSREDIGRLQIRPQENVVKAGEPVFFSGRVLGEFYQPIHSAEVSIQIEGEGLNLNDVLTRDAEFYRYQISDLPPGTYSYRLSAVVGERQVGKSAGKFVIEETSLELTETTANAKLMRDIARLSGGKSWQISEIDRCLNSLRFDRRVTESTVEIVLWNKIHWLVLLILLLATEWFLRKRRGLL